MKILKNEPFTVTPNLVIDNDLGSLKNPIAALIYLILARYANGNAKNHCWPSQQALSDSSGASLSSSKRAISFLIKQKMIKFVGIKKSKKGQTKIYEVLRKTYPQDGVTLTLSKTGWCQSEPRGLGQTDTNLPGDSVSLTYNKQQEQNNSTKTTTEPSPVANFSQPLPTADVVVSNLNFSNIPKPYRRAVEQSVLNLAIAIDQQQVDESSAYLEGRELDNYTGYFLDCLKNGWARGFQKSIKWHQLSKPQQSNFSTPGMSDAEATQAWNKIPIEKRGEYLNLPGQMSAPMFDQAGQAFHA